MIPEYPFTHLIPGDFPVYAGRREDEADCEALWQPLYDFDQCHTAGGLRRRPCNRKQHPQQALPDAQANNRYGGP